MKGIKTICLALAASLCATFPAYGAYEVLYRETTSEPVAEGLLYREDLLLTERGWLPVRILEGQLSGSDLSLALLTEAQVNQRSTLSTLAAEHPDAVAAVNGDFFDTGLSTALGPVIQDGILLSSSMGDESLNTIRIDQEGHLSIAGPLLESYTLKNLSNRKELPVTHVNKPYLDENSLIVYDKAWAGLPPQKADALYLGISDGRILLMSERAADLESETPEWIVAARGPAAEALAEAFKVNQRVKLEIDLDPDLSRLMDVLGGGSLLVSDGEIPDTFSLPIPGNHPRTALGVDASGERFWMVTVDGRSASAAGMSEGELAAYLLSLGAHDAINLDGGGSTEMLVRRLGENALSKANTPSGGASRRIPTGLGILAPPSSGAPAGFKIEAESDRLLAGTSLKLEPRFYDRGYAPVTGDPDAVVWTVEGPGYFSDGRLYAEGPGEILVTGTFKDLVRTLSFTAHDRPVGLKFLPENLSLNLGESTSLRLKALTADGYELPLDPEGLVQVSERLGTLENGTFTASKSPASGKMTARLDGLQAEASVSVGYSDFVFQDFEAPAGTFLGYPASVTGAFDLDRTDPKSGKASGKLTYDFSTTDQTRAAYLKLDHLLYANPARLGLWVKGDQGGGHWLRARLKDSDGKTHVLDFARYVDWTGWQFVEADLPLGVTFPAVLERLYLVETDPGNQTSGALWVDDFTAFYKTPFTGRLENTPPAFPADPGLIETPPRAPAFSAVVLGDKGPNRTLLDRLVDLRLADLSENADLAFSTGDPDPELAEKLRTPLASQTPGLLQKSGLAILTLNNSAGGLRASSPDQIPWLQTTLEAGESDALVLVLSGPWQFDDPLEEALVLDWLEKWRSRTGGAVHILTPSPDPYFHSAMRKGNRILQAPALSKASLENLFEDYNLLRLYWDGNSLSYTVEPLYERR